MKTKANRRYTAKSGDDQRQALDVNLLLVLAIALVITLFVYAILLPSRTSSLGILLYDRGFTQPLVIFLAATVAALTLLKFIKLRRESESIKKSWIPNNIDFENPNSPKVISLEQYLAKDTSLLAVRCSRVLAAYIYSGSRQAATELALDDSSFYLSASESSYTFPRILVWAIPLLGFIGTVIGISQAVNGFSGFLEQAGNIDQIKEGIGTVTSGLAVAFDTTLLALFLSVVVMIPLVLVERFESRILLAADVFINDQILSHLKEKEENLDEDTLNLAMNQALEERLPTPEALIQPAQEYAQIAATQIAQSFVEEIGKVQEVSYQLIEQINQVAQTTLQERQAFAISLGEQQSSNRTLISELREIAKEIETGNSSISQGLTTQSEQISQQLEQAAQLLATRIAALEKCTVQISEIAKLQSSLETGIQSLEKVARLEQLLGEMQETLAQVRPVLEKLGKPRLIRFVEDD